MGRPGTGAAEGLGMPGRGCCGWAGIAGLRRSGQLGNQIGPRRHHRARGGLTREGRVCGAPGAGALRGPVAGGGVGRGAPGSHLPGGQGLARPGKNLSRPRRRRRAGRGARRAGAAGAGGRPGAITPAGGRGDRAAGGAGAAGAAGGGAGVHRRGGRGRRRRRHRRSRRRARAANRRLDGSSRQRRTNRHDVGSGRGSFRLGGFGLRSGLGRHGSSRLDLFRRYGSGRRRGGRLDVRGGRRGLMVAFRRGRRRLGHIEAVQLPQLDRHVLIDGAGVGHLLGNAQFGRAGPGFPGTSLPTPLPAH